METPSAVRKIGTWRSLGYLPAFRRDPIRLMDRLQKDHGDLVEFSLGSRKLLVCSHPDHAEEVLKTGAHHFRKSRLIFDKIVPVTGPRGLVQLEDDEARAHRQLTGASLSHEAIQAAYPDLVRSIQDGIEGVARAGEGGREIDLAEHVTEIVLRNAVILVLGRRADARALGHAFLEANRICGIRIRNLVSAPSWLPTPASRRLKRCLAVLDAGIGAAISEALRRPVDAEEASGKDLLSCLARAGLPPSQIRDHLLTFLFAGHETTASSLVWTLDLLARDAEAWERVRGECSAFADGPPALADLRGLSRTLNAYQESLRLFPPSWTLARQAVRATRVGGHAVKKGTLLLLGVAQIQRHPEFWDRPDLFLPERFEGEEPQRHSHSYIPFGGGSRICIGNRIALIEATLFLALLVPRLRLAPRPGHRPEIEALITAHPKAGFPTRVIRVERAET